MRLVLESDDLTIEEGELSTISTLVHPAEMTARLTGQRIKDGVIEGFSSPGSGEVQLLLVNCTVLDRRTGGRYRVPLFRVLASFDGQQTTGNTRRISLGFNGLAKVEVVDDMGQPLMRNHVFGVALEGMSIEVNGPEHSPLFVLLPPGIYRAYLADARRVEVEFAVSEGDGPLTVNIVSGN